MKGVAILFFLILFFSVLNAPIFADDLRYIFIKNHDKYGPIRVYAVEADLTKYKIALVLAGGKIGETDKLSEIAKKQQAIAAINGTFFNLQRPSLPIGNILIHEDRLVFLSEMRRTHCIIKKDKIFFDTPDENIRVSINIDGSHNYFYAWGLNRPKKQNEVIIYTPEYGERTRTWWGPDLVVRNKQIVSIIAEGNAIIPADGFVISVHGRSNKIAQWLPVGAKINLRWSLKNSWRNAEQIFAGGPRLLDKGRIVVKETMSREHFRGYLVGRNPRSAIGVTAANRIILVVVDGRQRQSVGVSFWKLAEILRELGATEAMALDGGNSSALWLNGKIINSPSGGGRDIPNALLILKK